MTVCLCISTSCNQILYLEHRAFVQRTANKQALDQYHNLCYCWRYAVSRFALWLPISTKHPSSIQGVIAVPRYRVKCFCMRLLNDRNSGVRKQSLRWRLTWNQRKCSDMSLALEWIAGYTVMSYHKMVIRTKQKLDITSFYAYKCTKMMTLVEATRYSCWRAHADAYCQSWWSFNKSWNTLTTVLAVVVQDESRCSAGRLLNALAMLCRVGYVFQSPDLSMGTLVCKVFWSEAKD